MTFLIWKEELNNIYIYKDELIPGGRMVTTAVKSRSPAAMMIRCRAIFLTASSCKASLFLKRVYIFYFMLADPAAFDEKIRRRRKKNEVNPMRCCFGRSRMDYFFFLLNAFIYSESFFKKTFSPGAKLIITLESAFHSDNKLI